MQLKIALDIFRSLCKVNEDIAFIFVFGEFLDYGGFSNSTSTFHQQSFLPVSLLFPCEKLVINLSFEKHVHHLTDRIAHLPIIRKFNIATFSDNTHVYEDCNFQ